jgi:hypothetical protein
MNDGSPEVTPQRSASTLEASPNAASPGERRILALVLPELLLELVQRGAPARSLGAFGVVRATGPRSSAELAPSSVLVAVSQRAEQCGVRVGQTLAQASALVAGFEGRVLAAETIEQALATVAEVALGFGAPVMLGPPDTV